MCACAGTFRVLNVRLQITCVKPFEKVFLQSVVKLANIKPWGILARLTFQIIKKTVFNLTQLSNY